MKIKSLKDVLSREKKKRGGRLKISKHKQPQQLYFFRLLI